MAALHRCSHYLLCLSLSLLRQGRLDEGLAEMLKARELDPLSTIIARQVSLHYHLKRDYVRALQILRQANEIGPAFTASNEIGIYIQNRLYEEALADLEKAKRERKNDPILIYSTGLVRAAQGKRLEALAIINELERLSGMDLSQVHWIAKIYASLDEKDLAFNWLDRGLKVSAIGVFYKDEPAWDPLRSDRALRTRWGEWVFRTDSSQREPERSRLRSEKPLTKGCIKARPDSLVILGDESCA